MTKEAADFEEAKLKKERGMTVKDILESDLKRYKDIESIVVISMDKNGVIDTGYSWEGSTKALGMLVVAQSQIVDYMED